MVRPGKNMIGEDKNLGRSLMVNMTLSKNDRFKYKDGPREKISLNFKKGGFKKEEFLNSWQQPNI